MLCVFWKDLYQDAGVGSLGTDDSFLLFFFFNVPGTHSTCIVLKD